MPDSGFLVFFFFQAEDGIRDVAVTGVQTCALPILAGELIPARLRGVAHGVGEGDGAAGPGGRRAHRGSADVEVDVVGGLREELADLVGRERAGERARRDRVPTRGDEQTRDAGALAGRLRGARGGRDAHGDVATEIRAAVDEEPRRGLDGVDAGAARAVRVDRASLADARPARARLEAEVADRVHDDRV